MSDQQVRRLIKTYLWGLILLGGGIVFALATIPSFNQFMPHPEKAIFPMSLVSPSVALVSEGIAAPGMIWFYLKSRRLLALPPENRREAYQPIRDLQKKLGQLMLVGAALITPLSFVFFVWAPGSPVGLVFTYLLYAGAGIQFKMNALNKQIDFPEAVKKTATATASESTAEPAAAEPAADTHEPKPTQERGGGAFGLTLTALVITALTTLPVYAGFLTGNQVSNGDLGATMALSVVELFVMPTGLIAAIYSLSKRQELARRTALLAAIALLLAIFPWGFRLGG